MTEQDRGRLPEPDVQAHRSPPRWSAPLAACWIACLTLALCAWLLDLATGAQAGAIAAIGTAATFIFVILATPGRKQ